MRRITHFCMLADGPCNSLGRVLKVVTLHRRTRFCVSGSLIQIHVLYYYFMYIGMGFYGSGYFSWARLS